MRFRPRLRRLRPAQDQRYMRVLRRPLPRLTRSQVRFKSADVGVEGLESASRLETRIVKDWVV